jgi:hypothetical protein
MRVLLFFAAYAFTLDKQNERYTVWDCFKNVEQLLKFDFFNP